MDRCGRCRGRWPSWRRPVTWAIGRPCRRPGRPGGGCRGARDRDSRGAQSLGDAVAHLAGVRPHPGGGSRRRVPTWAPPTADVDLGDVDRSAARAPGARDRARRAPQPRPGAARRGRQDPAPDRGAAASSLRSNDDEAIEVSRIHSVAGLVDRRTPVTRSSTPPRAAPHRLGAGPGGWRGADPARRGVAGAPGCPDSRRAAPVSARCARRPAPAARVRRGGDRPGRRLARAARPGLRCSRPSTHAPAAGWARGRGPATATPPPSSAMPGGCPVRCETAWTCGWSWTSRVA